MVTSLLDTAILVDLVRKYPPAVAWIAIQQDVGVSSVVWLELLQDAQDKTDQQKALKLLGNFARVEILQVDFDWAIASLVKVHPKPETPYSFARIIGAVALLNQQDPVPAA